ncbi:class I SAM-dependent methyltransferase [Tenacibaculum adriaticum]|uniref:class I SAM-dependent methyltransferase n=1 Tax=Tenacibaculum adriaticum TaxID=413713 RepID=UPI0011E60FF0|nr:class I SAM-dependent methyltransferase [Tenacibaculum adriaticum]
MTEKINNNLEPFLNSIDYTVSKEEYQLLFNKEFDMLVTQPVPKNLGDYYKSEDYISHTDSSKSIIDKVYKLVRNYTLKTKLNLLNSFNSKEKTLLDIGSGTGDFLAICKQNNWKVSGIEPNKKAREISITKKLVVKENLSEINEKFDVITMWHVLEHVPDLIEYIQQLKGLLKPDGVLVIAVPNFKSYDAKHYKQFWAAFDVPRHLWHFSKTSIRKLFSTVEMKIEKVLPMKFDSYYVSLLSEKYKTGKMRPIHAFINGFMSNRKAKASKEHSSLIYIIKNR